MFTSRSSRPDRCRSFEGAVECAFSTLPTAATSNSPNRRRNEVDPQSTLSGKAPQVFLPGGVGSVKTHRRPSGSSSSQLVRAAALIAGGQDWKLAWQAYAKTDPLAASGRRRSQREWRVCSVLHRQGAGGGAHDHWPGARARTGARHARQGGARSLRPRATTWLPAGVRGGGDMSQRLTSLGFVSRGGKRHGLICTSVGLQCSTRRSRDRRRASRSCETTSRVAWASAPVSPETCVGPVRADRSRVGRRLGLRYQPACAPRAPARWSDTVDAGDVLAGARAAAVGGLDRRWFGRWADRARWKGAPLHGRRARGERRCLLDPTPEPVQTEPDSWRARRAPDGISLLLGGVVERLRRVGKLGRLLVRLARHHGSCSA